MRRFVLLLLVAIAAIGASAESTIAGVNRFRHLEQIDPYYVSRDFPRLVTPQWIGEPGVEAVVILAIDDMRGYERWEAFLRPIIDRLKQIDGRAPVSIMTIRIDPKQPHLQTWLAEGLSLETHTADHPCPLLKDGDFKKARSTYDRCVDLMFSVPNSRPVAYRMPCCDSLNTVSPRFFSEIFNRTTPTGNFLSIDSSVFVVLTSNDPALPRRLVQDSDGRERFRKYLPFPSFVNTVEDYPYPYPIGPLCWEFPCIVPSDWEAQNLQKPNNPRTVEDMQAAIDAVVAKQGVFDLVFHPHGWIRSEQIVQLIDHAVAKYGRKIKFLTFREARDRLNRNLLAGQPLRAADGGENGVRIVDLDGDGFQDVVIGNSSLRRTRLWQPATHRWRETDFPVALVEPGSADGKRDRGEARDAGVRFGVVHQDGHASLVVRNDRQAGGWHFDGQQWVEDARLLAGLTIDGKAIFTARHGIDRGVRMVDLDDNGRAEMIVGNPHQRAVFSWSDDTGWKKLAFTLPGESRFVDDQGHDWGLRLKDVDDDRQPDVLFSGNHGDGLYLFDGIEKGWTTEVARKSTAKSRRIPRIVRGQTNNGAWFHSRHLWVQNEDTARLPDLVERRSFNDMIAGTTPRPKSPRASLKALRPRDGFQVQLVAAEPLTVDPIDFDWGPDGRLWVAEMGDYPQGPEGHGKAGGRVRFLEDLDGDGQYDHASMFLDKLHYPTGVMAWRDGVLVISAPDIFYAQDTDGDGKADRREVLFTGLSRANPQHLANGLVRGLDNWIYCAGSSNTGKLRSLKTGRTVTIRGRDFRIQPDRGLIEPLLGVSQFIRSRDAWGHWFGSNNIDPMFQFLLEDHYLARNPYLPSPYAVRQVSEQPGSAPVFPRSRTIERFNDLHTANRFTSACSSIMYRDDLFGPAFSHSSFVSEPVHNLVHREVTSIEGLAYHSHRAVDEQRSEFLASTDNWFRPTRLRTGPDGALWVADMYRYVIEHPEWIPPSMQQRLDLRAGSDRGRIYRVFPVGVPLRPMLKFDKMATPRLVAALESPNAAVRDLAGQVLVERAAPESIEMVRRLAGESKSAEGRLHAMYTLAGLHALDADLLKQRLGDSHPGVRRHALRLCEPLLADHDELAAAMIPLADDDQPAVRLQLAYTLGEWDDPRAGRLLAKLALEEAEHPLIEAAIMSSVTRRLGDVVDAIADSVPQQPQAEVLAKLLAVASAMNQADAMLPLIRIVAGGGDEQPATWQLQALGDWLDALGKRNESLASLHAHMPQAVQRAIAQLGGLFDYARRLAIDAKGSDADRLVAIRLLGRGLDHADDDGQLLRELLRPKQSATVQQAAIRGLGHSRLNELPTLLLADWREYGPTVRVELLDLMLQRTTWVEALLDALEKGAFRPTDLDAARRQQLLGYRSKSIRQRAARLLAGATSSNRQEVLDRHRAVLSLAGDAHRGEPIFNKRCAVCHHFREQGFPLGPDLSALTDKSNEALLLAMLDPNRAVEAKFVAYNAVTSGGLIYTGLLTAETSSSVTLLAQEGKQHTLLRSELDVLESTGKSLMPEGLENDLSPQNLADVMAYLRSGTPAPKAIRGNSPALVTADPLRSELFCLPNNAEIYGDTLTIDETSGALSGWHSEADHVAWTIEAPRDSTYLVILEWSCDDQAAGNSFVLEVGGQRLIRTVEGTGGWSRQRRTVIGRLKLAAGKHRLGVRSDGRINAALFNLMSITVRPVSP